MKTPAKHTKPKHPKCIMIGNVPRPVMKRFTKAWKAMMDGKQAK